MMRQGLAGFALCVVVAGCAAGSNPEVDAAAIRAAIEANNQVMQQATNARDFQKNISYYAADAVVMFANMPKVVGHTDILKLWQDMTAMMPNFKVTWQTDQLQVAKAGDYAIDTGRYQLTYDTPQGPVEDVGKFLVVWKNVDGEWKVAYDSGSSDKPLPTAEAQK